MTRDPAVLRAIAGLFDYPHAELAVRAAGCAEGVAEAHPRAAGRLARFATWALASGDAAVEEAYTAAFDLAPLASPYVGDQLFGATRERSFLLSGLAALRRDAGVEPGAELADHVAEVLRLAAAPIPDDVREDLVRDGLVPALTKMHAALEAARHPWADVVAAALDALGARADAAAAHPLEATP
jgi:nitrate reductase delta subunit